MEEERERPEGRRQSRKPPEGQVHLLRLTVEKQNIVKTEHLHEVKWVIQTGIFATDQVRSCQSGCTS